jgi:Mor family transcriptional regulator
MIPEVQGRVVEENDNEDGDEDEISKLMMAMMRKKSGTSIRLPSGGAFF